MTDIAVFLGGKLSVDNDPESSIQFQHSFQRIFNERMIFKITRRDSGNRNIPHGRRLELELTPIDRFCLYCFYNVCTKNENENLRKQESTVDNTERISLVSSIQSMHGKSGSS